MSLEPSHLLRYRQHSETVIDLKSCLIFLLPFPTFVLQWLSCAPVAFALKLLHALLLPLGPALYTVFSSPIYSSWTYNVANRLAAVKRSTSLPRRCNAVHCRRHVNLWLGQLARVVVHGHGRGCRIVVRLAVDNVAKRHVLPRKVEGRRLDSIATARGGRMCVILCQQTQLFTPC